MKRKPVSTPTDALERWTVVQVAACLSIPYQTARNQMLAGEFGESHYDGVTRRLTVLSARVMDAKTARAKTRRKRPARRK